MIELRWIKRPYADPFCDWYDVLQYRCGKKGKWKDVPDAGRETDRTNWRPPFNKPSKGGEG